MKISIWIAGATLALGLVTAAGLYFNWFDLSSPLLLWILLSSAGLYAQPKAEKQPE